VFLVALAAGSCGRTQGARARGDNTTPIAARVIPVEQQVVQRRVQAVGSLFALEESTVSSEVGGRVEQVLADVGDVVREGQPLVQLANVEFKYEVERQRAAVRQVRAQLGLTAEAPLPSDPNQVAAVQRAAADMFDAEQKFKRAQQLFEEKLISQQQLDEASSRYKSARATYDVAVQDVERLKAQLQSSEAAARLAEKKLADTTIKAPFPGTIKERRASPGEYLAVQSPVAVVVRTDQLRARIDVPEKWAGSLRAGTEIEIRVEAYPNEVFRGRVVRISPSVASETRTFLVEALLANSDGRLKPGFFIQASLPSTVEEKTLVVPERAVTYRYGVYKVFVVRGERVEEREIKTGNHSGEKVEVVDGLAAGDRIAFSEKGELFNGATIRPAE